MGSMMRLRQGTEARLFPGSLAISVGLHLALATLVLVWVGAQKPAAPPVLTVSLVAPDPGLAGPGEGQASAGAPAGKIASSSAPPTPVKKQASPLPKAKDKPPKRKALPVARSEPEEVWPIIPPRPVTPPVVKAPASPAPMALPPAPSPSIVTTPVSAGVNSGETGGQGRDGAGSGGTAGASTGSGRGGGEGTGEGGGRSLVEAQRHYLNIVRTRILAKRQYPALARQRHEEGVVRLRFTLSPGGALAQGVKMVKPSGFQLLDDQAQYCVLAASPFPPFPPDLKRDRLTVEVPIVYKLTELGM